VDYRSPLPAQPITDFPSLSLLFHIGPRPRFLSSFRSTPLNPVSLHTSRSLRTPRPLLNRVVYAEGTGPDRFFSSLRMQLDFAISFSSFSLWCHGVPCSSPPTPDPFASMVIHDREYSPSSSHCRRQDLFSNPLFFLSGFRVFKAFDLPPQASDYKIAPPPPRAPGRDFQLFCFPTFPHPRPCRSTPVVPT